MIKLNNQCKTEKFESVISDIAIEKCLKYSDEPEKLKELISHLSVEVKFTGIKKHFADDTVERLTGIFQVSKDSGYIASFDFGFSIYDTEAFSFDSSNYESKKYKGKVYNSNTVVKLEMNKDKQKFFDDLLYSCLTSCRMDFYCPKDFDDFCNELGYGNDSIKANEIFKTCLKISAQLERVFTEEELNYLPS